MPPVQEALGIFLITTTCKGAIMKTAFNPNPIVFMHICRNCSNAKMIKVSGSKHYICKISGLTHLPGNKCTVPVKEDKSEQMTMDI